MKNNLKKQTLKRKDLANHIYEEYGGDYDVLDLRSLCRSIGMFIKASKESYEDKQEQQIFFRGVLIGLSWMSGMCFEHCTNSFCWTVKELIKGEVDVLKLYKKLCEDKIIWNYEIDEFDEGTTGTVTRTD